MKTKFFSSAVRWYSVSFLMTLSLWLCYTTSASADTLKLKDGTQVEGDIVGENDQSIRFELNFDNGTITTRRTYLKSDIANIVRTPPDEKRKQKMEYWYGKVMRYQLTNTSFQVEYYDQVIKQVFEKYLTVFPESPNTKTVQDLKAQWQAERLRVAAGEVKRDSKWMTTAAADQLTQDQKAMALLESSRSLTASREFKLAWLQISKAVGMTQNPDVVKQMVETGRNVYFKYLEYLTMKENWMKTQVDYQERRVARADVSAANVAQQDMFSTPMEETTASGDEKLRSSTEAQGDAVRAQSARANEALVQMKQKVAQVHDEIAQLKQKKADWDAGMEVGGIKKSDIGK